MVPDIGAMAEKLGRYGADNVILADAPELKIYMTEPYAHVLTQIIQDKKPEIVLYGATAIGRDLAPRVSGTRTYGAHGRLHGP